MKILFLSLLLIGCINVSAQNDRLKAFDGAINLSMANRSNQDLSVNISAGLSGRRIPLSIFVGYGCAEFDNDYTKMKYSHPTQWGYNVTGMLRMFHINERNVSFNIYGTEYRFKNDYFYEYGGKVGIMINDRSIIYANVGEMKGAAKYESLVLGVHFSLLFFNGYGAY